MICFCVCVCMCNSYLPVFIFMFYFISFYITDAALMNLHCCRLRQLEKSAVVEHTLANPFHRVLFYEIRIMSSVSSYFPRLYMGT